MNIKSILIVLPPHLVELASKILINPFSHQKDPHFWVKNVKDPTFAGR